MKEMLLLFVMFWNVENFFDTYDNPSTNDETFTPAGENHWNWKRFEKKRDDIAKTILLATDECGEMPVLVGPRHSRRFPRLAYYVCVRRLAGTGGNGLFFQRIFHLI
mgnify:CR=1 FL=1